MSEALASHSFDVDSSVHKAAEKKSMRWGLESPDELIGRRIDGRYTIVEKIARGGMGTVFKAIQAPMGRVCAVKVLSASYEGGKNPAFDKRFRREAETISRLVHPSTVTLYDYGNIDDLFYMAMEYVDGRTLHAEIFHEGRFKERRARQIAMQICSSLREAHEHGVIHRDLKPDNIVLVDRAREEELVKVLDFGLAKVFEGDLADEDVTETGLCMGSPKHMAPEQIVGDAVSPHTDIYALGILMYEMLTAHSPFDRSTRYQTLVAQVHEQPMSFAKLLPDADISAGMERVVMQCLQKERHRRFRSMDDLLQALKALDRVSLGSMSSVPSVSDIVSGPIETSLVEGTSRSPQDLRDRPRSSRHGVYPPAAPLGSLFTTSCRSQGAAPSAAAVHELRVCGQVPCSACHGRRGRRDRFGDGARRMAIDAGERSAAARLAWLRWYGLRDGSPTPSVSASAFTDRKRTVWIDSIPPRAKVFDKDEDTALCDATPCRVTWTGRQASRVHVLRFELAGYVKAEHEVTSDDERVVVTLKLLGRSKARVSAGGEDLVEDTGYKYSPY